MGRFLSLVLLALLAACGDSNARAPEYTYQVIRSYPHDRAAFTQGLVFCEGRLFEGTGLEGRSSLREVELETGTVIRQRNLSSQYFGEGIAILGERVFQLTWMNGKVFQYRKADFELEREIGLPGEGWGLTTDGKRLVMSDGSNQLRFLDPDSFAEVRRVAVTAQGQPVTKLNELEWVDGEVYANIWQSNWIVKIDPGNGEVTGWIDLTGLLQGEDFKGAMPDVLNGIAYDPKGKRLFVTGKLWPKIFEIKLSRKTGN